VKPSTSRVLVLGLLAVAFSQFGPIGRAAAAKTVEQPASFQFEAELPETDGFTIFLRADDRRHVKLEIESKTESPYTTLDYSTLGEVRRHGIDVDFGEFGQIDLHFLGKPRRSRYRYANCNGKKFEVEESGAMAGTIDFEALGGVVKLHTDRVADGGTSRSPRRTCMPRPRRVYHGSPGISARARRSHEEGFLPLRTLLARGHAMGRLIDLYVFDLEGELDDAAATSTHRFGPVLVETTVHSPEGEEGAGQGPELTITGEDPRPDGARLSLAAPFTGSATFRKRPGAPPTWLGSLAVKLPGEGTLPLAGPEFHAIVCGYEEPTRQSGCEATVAPPHIVIPRFPGASR
jgi:hypothetical protein